MKILLYIFTLIILGSCSDKPKIATPLFAAETLLNLPRIGPSKTETENYQIVSKDQNFTYWGYYTLNWKMDRVLNPCYKTPKQEYQDVLKRSSHIEFRRARAVIQNWFLQKYPELENDTIKISQTAAVKLSENLATKKIDANCTGWIEFYNPKMEKSREPGIDSVMTNHIIKKFNYSCTIENANKISSIKID